VNTSSRWQVTYCPPLKYCLLFT